jgi:biotin carboxyl carrier protein
MADGDELSAGDEIGVVEGPGTSCPILSPFGGTLMGMLAHPGERLRSGQPIAWLRVA